MKKLFVYLCFVTVTVHAQQNITLEDIFVKGSFRSKSYHIQTLNDDKQFVKEEVDSVTKHNNLNCYDILSGAKTKTMFNGSDLKINGKVIDYDNFTLSVDEKKILFSAETEAIYRHSTQALHYVFDLETKKITDLSTAGKVMLCTLSPDGNKVAYVRDNNLYIRNLTALHEEMITHDGLKNHIINGAPDWVYEEEFSFNKGFEWSPDGKKIAFMRFDESAVKEFTITYYDSLYPRQEKYKYPKAGETNSTVQVIIIDLENGKQTQADLGTEKDQYVPRIGWTANADILYVYKLNRLQNKLDVLTVNNQTGKTQLLFTETDKTYIDIDNSAQIYFTADGKNFIWSSYESGYNNLWWYDISGKKIKPLTQLKKDVLQFYGYNEKLKTAYYQSYENTPVDKQIYSVTLNGKTQLLSYNKGSNTAFFSNGFSYFVNAHSDANHAAKYELYKTNTGKVVRLLEDNAALNNKIQSGHLSEKTFFTIPNRNGTALQAWMIKPADFDASKKYPVLMYVYGGPGAPTVNNTAPSGRDFWYYLLAQKGYIIVSVDNRGTTKQGYEFLRSTYMQLGKHECEDQIDAAKWLGSQAYVDAKRIGIWGWSFGGYLTALCMAKGNDVFKAGMSVAPVTNWRFYDSIYTERYLRTPQQNASGYDDNSPINFAEKIKGRFLLVHGTADDNVHYQNTMMFANKLIKHNVSFESMNYPNRNHGINGGGATMHIYNLMTNFVLNNL
ncbi:MAG: S9 family peptidase [Bacteroidia bacterium]|nr:S9 family peptidase [Bacteroidia bacterium]HQU99542.1 S9 family peptidase [Bacteroidia bacterium]